MDFINKIQNSIVYLFLNTYIYDIKLKTLPMFIINSMQVYCDPTDKEI